MNGIQTYVDDYGTKRVRAVETSRGTIKTNTVVNAAGEQGKSALQGVDMQNSSCISKF